MRTGLKLASAALAAALLSGCASTSVSPELRSTATTAAVTDSLAKAAQDAASAQNTLARIQTARTAPSAPSVSIDHYPEELRRPSTLDWSGPAHEAAERIANLVGYGFDVVGNRPSIPPMIHITVADEPAGRVLEQIGQQAHPYGEVFVNPNEKKVLFRFLESGVSQPARAQGSSPSLNAK